MWVFAIISGLSLVVCVGVGVLWIRSYRVAESIYWVPDTRHGLWIVLDWGRLRVQYDRQLDTSWFTPRPGLRRTVGPAGRGYRGWERMPGSDTWLDWREFRVVTGERWQAHHIAVFVPCWFVSFVLAVLPAAWWLYCRRVLRQRLRVQHGLRRVCGYDLRATPQRCPECGTEVQSARNGATTQAARPA
jgi:hypothetical protein